MTLDRATLAFRMNLIAALDDDTLYVAGVATELEERDVPHTIIWERVEGEWRRFQWKNRTYAMTAYVERGDAWSVYLGYEGTLKVRGRVGGSREEVLEGGPDGPSSLRTVSCIRALSERLLVCGMRRMVYARSRAGGPWQRLDGGLRLERSDLALAGLYGIDADDSGRMYAVGIGGEVWLGQGGVWRLLDVPTKLTWLSVRCLPGGEVVAGGELGALWILKDDVWREIPHAYRDETFHCIEYFGQRCFVISGSGACYELSLASDLALSPWTPEGLGCVSSAWHTSERIWFVGESRIMSLGHGGWRDESPPTALM